MDKMCNQIVYFGHTLHALGLRLMGLMQMKLHFLCREHPNES